jgi:predicted transcriptional regulator
MSTRLNARIDPELADKIDRLRRRTNMSITDIVRASIELYYERFRAQEAADAHRILVDAGFVGCGEAEPDLSTSYKDRLADSLSGKAGA